MPNNFMVDLKLDVAVFERMKEQIARDMEAMAEQALRDSSLQWGDPPNPKPVEIEGSFYWRGIEWGGIDGRGIDGLFMDDVDGKVEPVFEEPPLRVRRCIDLKGDEQ